MSRLMGEAILHYAWGPESQRQRCSLLENSSKNIFLQQYLMYMNCWKQCFLCNPCQGYIMRAGEEKYGHGYWATWTSMIVLALVGNKLPHQTIPYG
jgi:hypothetical protein